MRLHTEISLLVASLVFGAGTMSSFLAHRITVQTLQDQLEEKGLALAQVLSRHVRHNVEAGDAGGARDALREAARHTQGLIYAYATDFDGQIFAHSFQGGLPEGLRAEAETSHGAQVHRMQWHGTADGPVLCVAWPLAAGRKAHVHLGLSEAGVHRQANSLRNRILSVTLAVALLGIVIGFLMSGRITRPLARLADSMRDFGRGIRPAAVDVRGGGREVRELAGVFETMIDDRRRAEEALRLTQFSVDRSTDAVFWMGPDARFVYVSESACRALGYSRDELLSMTVHDIDPDFPQEVWPAHWRDLKKHGSLILDSHHRAKDGRIVPVEVAANYVEFEGKEYNCAFARDVTERKRAEQQRRELQEQVQYAQKLESLGVLAGGIAHDFNNLLVAVLGNAELALDDMPADAPQRRSIEEIRSAARRAAELTNQMLAYSGKGQFSVRAVDLNDLVREMGGLLEVSISKRAALTYELAEELPAVSVDVNQLRQVVMNLITNASEAIGEAEGAITIRTSPIQADREYLKGTYLAEELPAGLYVCLEVRDTGCGMDDEARARLFDPFFTTKFAGRGLGLAAVLGIVRGHRGAIQFDSEPGKGTTFRVLLPATHAEAEPAAPSPLADVEQWRPGGTVLVADDERNVRGVLQTMLERFGFTVLTAADGREAVEAYRSHADEIVAVLLDMTMPQLGGNEACREIRRIRPDAKVVLMSGYNEQEAVHLLSSEGAACFLHKPFDLADLMSALRAAMAS